MERQTEILQDKREAITRYCMSNPIRSLRLFGSYLHGTSRADSDIDLLVEFDQGARVGLFDLTRMQLELSDLTGHTIDLRTSAELSPYFRHKVLLEAEPLYVR